MRPSTRGMRRQRRSRRPALTLHWQPLFDAASIYVDIGEHLDRHRRFDIAGRNAADPNARHGPLTSEIPRQAGNRRIRTTGSV